MKTSQLLMATTLLAFSTFVPAASADGIYVFGALNSTTQENFQSRNTGSNEPNDGAASGASTTVVDKDTSAGFALGVGLQKYVSEDIFLGAEAFYSTESADTTTLNNVKINHVTLNSTYGADVRLGTKLTEKVAVYGLLGASAYDFDSAISYTFAPPKDDVSDTVWGLTYGAGLELMLGARVSTFGEFRLSHDVSFDTPVDRGGIQANEDLDYTVLRTGLRYKF